jgi:chemotaxis protein methyltransferase CheR
MEPNDEFDMNRSVLEKIGDFVNDRSRLSFSGHKRSVLSQRLSTRLTQLNLPDLAVYWEYLQRTPEEEQQLLDAVTTNETFFFRNGEQFNYLAETILPQLEKARGLDVVRSWGEERVVLPSQIMKLRILSAGCSTGEEPYSLAMTVLESLRYPKAWDIEILAGDLSDSCLATARAGFYEAERLKTVPPRLLGRYFVEAPGGATVTDEVRRIVRLVSLNLNDILSGREMPGFDGESFDIIFCRNVMIYFSSPCQQTLIDSLYRLLARGGYLFTGDAEPLHIFTHDFRTVGDARCLVYQRPENM